MNIDFTPDEYRTLVELLLAADWVLRGHELQTREETRAYAQLVEKVRSHHRETGMSEPPGSLPDHPEDLTGGTLQDIPRHMRLVKEYEERVFWGALASRLAYRDLPEKEQDKVENQDYMEQRALQYYTLMERYRDEFEENGLDNLRVELKSVKKH